MLFHNSEQVKEFVKAGGRPTISAESKANCPEIVALIESCWHQDPACRPSFADVVKKLQDPSHAFREVPC